MQGKSDGFALSPGGAQIHRQVSLRTLTAFFFDRFAMGERWGGCPKPRLGRESGKLA